MSDIRFNNWKHQSGTGGVSQNSGGNVGIGSTLPSSKLDVGGDVKVTGIVTANSFSGNLTGNVTGSAANITGRAEVYGFTGIGSDLQVTTTNAGADNITGAQYDAFEQVLFAPSGITFSINTSGNLIATI